MKWLADENISAPVVAALRHQGHDVVAVAESMPGAIGADVIAVAIHDGRILLTLDRDYGDLIFHFDIPRRRAWSCFASLAPGPLMTIVV